MDTTRRARTRYSWEDSMTVTDGVVDDGTSWCTTCKVWQSSEYLSCSEGGDSGEVCSICGSWTDT
jgi:hypothetical protein